MLRLLILLVLMTILTACGTHHHKAEYTYQPPQSNMDKKCVTQCAQGKRYCQQICQLKHPRCFFQAHQHALNQYKIYKQERIRKGEKVIKTLHDFEQSAPCYNACNCVPSFNTCYTACGGQVIERSSG